MERIWTKETMAEGYREMSELNLLLAALFAPLEAEAAEIIEDGLKAE